MLHVLHRLLFIAIAVHSFLAAGCHPKHAHHVLKGFGFKDATDPHFGIGRNVGEFKRGEEIERECLDKKALPLNYACCWEW